MTSNNGGVMPILHIFWDEHKNIWPPDNNGRRWSDFELDELMGQLNRIGLSQVSDAIGSLRFDKIEMEGLWNKK
jgi:hypothetical protein